MWVTNAGLKAKGRAIYHISPSKKMSLGIASMICWGKANTFPLREKNVLFSGFQNPRIPSYFSNNHLLSKVSLYIAPPASPPPKRYCKIPIYRIDSSSSEKASGNGYSNILYVIDQPLFMFLRQRRHVSRNWRCPPRRHILQQIGSPPFDFCDQTSFKYKKCY